MANAPDTRSEWRSPGRSALEFGPCPDRKSGAQNGEGADGGGASPDPESGTRNQPREPRLEHAAGLCPPPNRGESGAHPEESQMPIPKTEGVCCPNWATPILSSAADRLNPIGPKPQVLRIPRVRLGGSAAGSRPSGGSRLGCPEVMWPPWTWPRILPP